MIKPSVRLRRRCGPGCWLALGSVSGWFGSPTVERLRVSAARSGGRWNESEWLRRGSSWDATQWPGACRICWLGSSNKGPDLAPLLSRTDLTLDDGGKPVTERLVSRSSFFKIRMLVIDPVRPVAGQLIQAALSQIIIKTEFA